MLIIGLKTRQFSTQLKVERNAASCSIILWPQGAEADAKKSEKIKAWFKLQLDVKDAYGNHPLKVLRPEYGYQFERDITKYPLKGLDKEATKSEGFQAMRNGNYWQTELTMGKKAIPVFRYEPERLARVLAQRDPGFDNVLEFRHPGWWCEEVYAALRQRNITFCGMSYPGLPDEPVVTAPLVYYRFHGVPEIYRSSYSDTDLAAFIAKIKATPGAAETWCYFNNDSAVAAIAACFAKTSIVG